MNECFPFKLWFYQNALMYFIINGNKKTKYRDVVCNKYVSAEGYNRKFEDFDPSAHAEVVAIRNAGKALRTPELQGCILFTSCEPCPMCAATIWWSRLFSNTSFRDFGVLNFLLFFKRVWKFPNFQVDWKNNVWKLYKLTLFHLLKIQNSAYQYVKRVN